MVDYNYLKQNIKLMMSKEKFEWSDIPKMLKLIKNDEIDRVFRAKLNQLLGKQSKNLTH